MKKRLYIKNEERRKKKGRVVRPLKGGEKEEEKSP